MARDRINIRIELDHRTDADAREIAKSVERSKRNYIAMAVKTVVRLVKENPTQAKELGFVH